MPLCLFGTGVYVHAKIVRAFVMAPLSLVVVVCVVVACVVALHVANDMKVPADFKILQVSTDGLVRDVLARKYPVVVEPPASLPNVLTQCQRAGFLRTVDRGVQVPAHNRMVVRTDVQVIHCPVDCSVTVKHPLIGTEMHIRLYNDHLLVMPRRWEFAADEAVAVVSVDGPLGALTNVMMALV